MSAGSFAEGKDAPRPARQHREVETPGAGDDTPGDGRSTDDVTRMLEAIRNGNAQVGGELMCAVYAELRRIAGAKMARERPGQTIQATALVHEAWLRLDDQRFENRAHFFTAASEAMRRILVERARHKNRVRHGAGAEHLDIESFEIAAPLVDNEELLAVHEALDLLAAEEPRKSELVKLRYFAGLSFEEAAKLLGISVGTAKRDWAYARAWLHHTINSA